MNCSRHYQNESAKDIGRTREEFVSIDRKFAQCAVTIGRQIIKYAYSVLASEIAYQEVVS